MFRAGLNNFSKGEIGPQLYGRVDVSAYNAGVRRARNVVILKYGGLQRRMGTRFVYEQREPEDGWDDPDSAARLFPFEFSIEQTYALLFTQALMTPLALGGVVLEEELAITGISNAAQAVVTSAYHDYAVGDEWFASGIEGEIGDLLNNQVWEIVEIVDGDNFKIDADTSGLAAFSGADGGITRVGAPPVVVPPTVPPAYEPPPEPDVVFPGYGGGYYRSPDIRFDLDAF